MIDTLFKINKNRPVEAIFFIRNREQWGLFDVYIHEMKRVI